jgi:alpha-L-fucosidase 2
MYHLTVNIYLSGSSSKKGFTRPDSDQERGSVTSKPKTPVPMKIKLVIISLLMIAFGFGCDQEKNGDHLKLWYSQPANASIPDGKEGWKNDPEWLKALPVGNGSIGAMVFGDVNTERIQLNEKSLWSGSPADNDNPISFMYLDSIRNLLYAGKYREAHQLAEKTQVCKGAGSGSGSGANVPFGCFQTLGDLWIDFNVKTAYTDYHRELDMTDGITRVRYTQNGVKYTREVFTSYPDQVLVIRIAADTKGSISFTGSLTRPERFSTIAQGGELVMSGRMNNGTDGNGMKWMSRLKALNSGGSIDFSGNTLIVKNADAVTLLFSAATDYVQKPPAYSGKDFEKITAENIAKAAKRTYQDLLKRHLSDFHNLMGRVNLDITPLKNADSIPTDQRLVAFKSDKTDLGLSELYFQYGRYLLISSSREGSLPANLQGIWANALQTPWNCDYHTDINIQMNYWPVEVTNLAECQMPLTELIESVVEPGTRTAGIHYHAGGWAIHPITNVWGFTAPGEWPSWGLHLGAGAWMAQHLWEHYAFTGDREYLKRVYPVMKESAIFYLDWLVKDPVSGKLVSGPASSPENSFKAPDGSTGYLTMGPSHDQEVIWDLFTNLAEASEIMGIQDEFTKKVAEARNNLLMPGIGSDGRLMEWPVEFEEPEPGHRHMSHLFALHPGRQITSQTPEMQDAARKSLEYRLSHGGGHTGWSAAWLVNLWARLGDGDNSKKAIDVLLTKCTSPNFFDLHPPFQIDGNFGATSGIAEMLVQSHTGEIVLLPALPAAWPTGKISGLVARGGFVVGMEWKEGKLTGATVLSKNGGKCTVDYKGRKKNLEMKAGEKVMLSEI